MILEDRVALITGSGRGIGRAMARLFANEGARVFLTARSEADLIAASSEINVGSSGADIAAFVTADLAYESDCAQVVAAAHDKFGRIDILVNNAGHYGPVVPVEEYPLADFDNVIAVHLRAAFLLSKLTLPEMYRRGSGVILNISSLSAKSAFGWGSAYAAAKAGMLGLTRVTAAEGARQGVRVNALCPGPVTETVMSKELGATHREGEKTRRKPRRATRRIPQHHPAGTRTDRGRNRACGVISVLGCGERDHRASDQRGRRRGIFLKPPRNGQPATR